MTCLGGSIKKIYCHVCHWYCHCCLLFLCAVIAFGLFFAILLCYYCACAVCIPFVFSILCVVFIKPASEQAQQTNKQTNQLTNTQTNKQTKHTSKQRNKQTKKQTNNVCLFVACCIWIVRSFVFGLIVTSNKV